MRYATALAIVLSWMGAASAAQTAPDARIFPVRPIAERGAAGDSLNFDIIVRNRHAFPVELTELEVAYLDADGGVLISRRLDGNGGVPSIATLGERTHGSFSMFAHIRQNSVRVQVGRQVAAGEAIAEIGSSGSSLFPHLHYQLVDAPTMRGEGLPSYFRNISLRRGQATRPAPYGRVDSGDLVVSR
jgi:murein DD-endopeptidase MepM/ murein hydrolase activator NlpD